MIDPYVIFKLTTGEEIIGEVTNQNDYSVTVMNPFLVKNRVGVSADGKMVDQMTAAPYCAYAEDRLFIFELKHILFIKSLKSRVVSSYLNMVHEINMREMLEQDVDAYVDALEQILGKGREESYEESDNEETYDNSIHYLEGNETLH